MQIDPVFHRLNFLRIGTSAQDFRGVSSRSSDKAQTGPIQTPFEVVSAWNIRKDEVVYQVFISSKEPGAKIFRSIKDHFLQKEPVFNITLGTANFTASIDGIELINSDKIVEKSVSGFVLMHCAVPTKLIEELQFEKDEFGNYNFIEEDMMPGDFVANGNREVRKMNRLLFSITSNPIRVKLNSPYFEIVLQGQTINLQFMDS